MIFFGLGSNLSSSFGNRFENINKAILLLKENKIYIQKKSHFYESLAIHNSADPKFINCVISVKTNLSLKNIFSVILKVEKILERTRNRKNDPRTCDIDIIDYRGKVLNLFFENKNLIIPHPRLTYRNFVLLPLYEIFPNWIHPTTGDNVKNLIKKLNNYDKKSIFKINPD